MTRILQRTVVFLLLLQLANLPCELSSMAKDKSKVRNGIAQKLLGWGGPPGLLGEPKNPADSKVKEYFYARIEGKASFKSVEAGSESMMETTCREAARLNGTQTILTSFMDHAVNEKKPNDESGRVILDGQGDYDYSCKFTRETEKKYTSYDCSGKIQTTGTSDCWATGPGGSWSNCQCLVYFYFAGGQDAVNRSLRFED